MKWTYFYGIIGACARQRDSTLLFAQTEDVSGPESFSKFQKEEDGGQLNLNSSSTRSWNILTHQSHRVTRLIQSFSLLFRWLIRFYPRTCSLIPVIAFLKLNLPRQVWLINQVFTFVCIVGIWLILKLLL